MTLSASALSGFHQAELQLQASGSNITRAFLPNATAVEVQDNKLVATEDGIELSSEMVSLRMAQNLHSAMVSLVRTEQETTKSLLNMMG